jgi:hypothetical protein
MSVYPHYFPTNKNTMLVAGTARRHLARVLIQIAVRTEPDIHLAHPKSVGKSLTFN